MSQDVFTTCVCAYLILGTLNSLQTTTWSAPEGAYFLQINRSLRKYCKRLSLLDASVTSLTYTAYFYILERELRALSLDFAIDYN